jgi:hypothetical protein
MAKQMLTPLERHYHGMMLADPEPPFKGVELTHIWFDELESMDFDPTDAKTAGRVAESIQDIE